MNIGSLLSVLRCCNLNIKISGKDYHYYILLFLFQRQNSAVEFNAKIGSVVALCCLERQIICTYKEL